MKKDQKISYYVRILLVAAEVSLISFLSYATAIYLPGEMGRYISLDVLYCLPIIQAARLAAIHALRHSDTQASTLVGIVVALAWSATEAAIIWPDFPLNAFLLNSFTRSVVFTVLGRVVLSLCRRSEYAHKDMLTGLANRRELLERLEIEQVRSERSGRPYSLLYIDIDQFKSLNDAHGHHVGDEALTIMADILRGSSRKVDVAARIGGDEFVLLLPDTEKQACDILIKRIEHFSKQVFEERSWQISVSIGQATKIGKTEKVDSVIQLADENMYEAKKMKQQMMNGGSGQ
ncbi:MAG: diguanylate cyclase [Rhodocyclaceae bacterium]|nr:MAG: diguanylate cyclase [Rhodocyclaceae bacterium]TND05744.1 MAG: diguanylate cyclase [Rhodocyclaceae bacterium]